MSQGKRNWRDDPITEKQAQLIADIEMQADMSYAAIPSFTGKPKGEACDYIGKYVVRCHYSDYNPHEDAGDRI